MEKVVGIGGVFFKANDADALRRWYQQHLGIEIDPHTAERNSIRPYGRSFPPAARTSRSPG